MGVETDRAALELRLEAAEVTIALLIEALGPKPQARLARRLRQIRRGEDPLTGEEDPQLLDLAARLLADGLGEDVWGP